MERIVYLENQQRLELQNAARATCERTKRKHEDLARAYGKVIRVLARERQRARR